jgi:predicted NACHT family NTPase
VEQCQRSERTKCQACNFLEQGSLRSPVRGPWHRNLGCLAKDPSQPEECCQENADTRQIRGILMSGPLVSAFSGVGHFLVSAIILCQSLSGVSTFLVSAFLWCQSLFGVSTFLVPERLWCQHFSGARAFLKPPERSKTNNLRKAPYVP